jgi:hypothetical protein
MTVPLAIGALAVVLLPGLAGPAAASAVSAASAAPVPSPASPNSVLQALHIDANPPAELVFLVDTSDSMATENLYGKVKTQLTEYFQTLAVEYPQDQVVVITVGQGSANRVVYGPGSPPLAVDLPVQAHGGTTDFGKAFELAIDQLSNPPAGIKVGGVVLLSDGGMSAPSDPVYDGGKKYSAPGWKALRTRAQGLPIPVTGYAVPLTTNQGYIDDQDTALTHVFNPVRELPGGTSNLEGELREAAEQAVYGEVVNDTRGDSGQGVTVTWGGLPPDGKSLDLRSAGQRTVSVTLKSRTAHVPLYVTGFNVEAPGLSIGHGPLPPLETLRAGGQASFKIHLTWQRKTIGRSPLGGDTKAPGHLVLTGTVGSSWTQPLQSTFSETSFSPGGLSGGTVAFQATEDRGSYLSLLRIPLLVLAALLVLWFLSTLMTGILILGHVDGPSGHAVLLPVFPVLWFRTYPRLGIRGRLTVRRRLFSRTMHIKLRLNGRLAGDVPLRPGEQTIAGGIEIVHRPLFRRSDPYGRR